MLFVIWKGLSIYISSSFSNGQKKSWDSLNNYIQSCRRVNNNRWRIQTCGTAVKYCGSVSHWVSLWFMIPTVLCMLVIRIQIKWWTSKANELMNEMFCFLKQKGSQLMVKLFRTQLNPKIEQVDKFVIFSKLVLIKNLEPVCFFFFFHSKTNSKP